MGCARCGDGPPDPAVRGRVRCGVDVLDAARTDALRRVATEPGRGRASDGAVQPQISLTPGTIRELTDAEPEATAAGTASNAPFHGVGDVRRHPRNMTTSPHRRFR